MSSWGYEIFEDDFAIDVKDEFENAIEDGANIATATNQVLLAYEDVVDDEDDGPVLYLALAALQLEQGQLEESIKNKALAVIEEGKGLERWEEVGVEEVNERKKVLEEFKRKLLCSS